ncbi:DUF5658 family protein [Bacillus sp. E(2018)]|uniref:DUF5658 family protein n=1 Tax=Bacillus sp. E(2018) TaxID=2502239 RepID=UPI0010F64E4B|nr:DUF5658 family protein [Bacillus sp. E(2018)]
MERIFQFQRHLWICIGLAVFNAADALFTHQVLLRGGTELNPIMRNLYAIDPILFLMVKFVFSYLIVAVGLVSLRRWVQKLLYVAFVIYFFVIAWHVYLNVKFF